jgi:hypothetical protein
MSEPSKPDDEDKPPLIGGQNNLRTDLLPTMKNLMDAARDLSANAAFFAKQQLGTSPPNIEMIRVTHEMLSAATNTFSVLMTHGMNLAKYTSER